MSDAKIERINSQYSRPPIYQPKFTTIIYFSLILLIENNLKRAFSSRFTNQIEPIKGPITQY